MVLGRGRRGKNAQCMGTARHHSWVPVLLFLPQAAAQHPLSAHPQPKGFRKIGCTLLYFTFPSLPLLSPSRPAHPSPHGCRAVPRGCSLVLRPQGPRTQIFPSPAECNMKDCFFHFKPHAPHFLHLQTMKIHSKLAYCWYHYWGSPKALANICAGHCTVTERETRDVLGSW